MSHKKSSFAKLALFFGFGDSTAASRPLPPSLAAPVPPSRAGSDVGLAFVASMSAEDVAAVKAAVLFSRSDRHGAAAARATRGQKRVVPPPPPPEEEEEEGMDRAEAEGQQQRRRRPRGAARTTVSNKRSRQQEGGSDGVTVFLDLRQRPLTEEAQLVAEFLRRCFGCEEDLDGRDIYMYQGDKAFCSEECRHERIELDEMTRKHLSS